MAKSIPSITIPEFKTARTLITEFQEANSSKPLAAKIKAQNALHKSQPKFFKALFDGIWTKLADSFETIAQLNVPKSTIKINKAKYATSAESAQGGQLIKLTRTNEDLSMPKLLNFETELGADSTLRKSKVNSLQIQDTEDPDGDRSKYWIKEEIVLSNGSRGERYRAEKPRGESSKDVTELHEPEEEEESTEGLPPKGRLKYVSPEALERLTGTKLSLVNS